MFTWEFVLGRPRPGVMGVVNVTPDSFSDGGRWLDPDAAVAHGLALAEAGADLLDVGGESTRPGAEPVDQDEELRRVLPVVRGLARLAPGLPISIDTTKAAVAAQAVDAGATIVNDVSAGRSDPAMFGLVADRGSGLVVMHMLGEPRTMQRAPHYVDVVGEVGSFLRARVLAAHRSGVAPAAVLADPGIGFGKSLEHNLALLGALPQLRAAAGAPLLVGASRKGMIGALLAGADGAVPPVGEREEGTQAITVWAFAHGVSVARVHAVGSAVCAADLVASTRRLAA
ncbi:MAG: dihydropteroate synthase [Actinomycetia bacterium]|nr:dihydropteroate synthase [Actinomycetes bacterium]